MKKRLNFILCIILTLCIAGGILSTGVASYSNDVVTSSAAMLLINLDTDTAVYDVNSDVKWFAGNLSELMTFLLITEQERNPLATRLVISEEFVSGLSESDGSLSQVMGMNVTVKDLLAIMLLTSGSDAANLLAYHYSDGDIASFVTQMNAKAEMLGCDTTHYESPGYSASQQHYTNCYDTVAIYRQIMDNELYQELMSSPDYVLDGYKEGDEAHTVRTNNSIMNPDSPYYFRYTTGGLYAAAPKSCANLVVTTSYRDMNYIFVTIKGKNESEENVYADAKKLTTWAYLNLSDRKVIDSDDTVTEIEVAAQWGEYKLDLYADNSAYKTLPNEYESEKFGYKLAMNKKISLPIFEGQKLGKAKIYYDKKKIDTVDLIASRSAGVSMLEDTAVYVGSAYHELLPELPSEAPTEAPTAAPTQKPTKATDKTKATAASEQPTEG